MIQLRRFATDKLEQSGSVPDPRQDPGQELDTLVPDVKAGELHIVSVPSRSRAEALIVAIAEQAATAVISPWRDADSASSNVSATLSATNVTLATWKYARKTNPIAICRSLTRFNRHFRIVKKRSRS